MSGPQKKLSGGITATRLNLDGDVLIGSGSGQVQLLSKINLTVLQDTQVLGAVTGLALTGPHYYVGTTLSNMYFINGANFHSQLRLTCHSESISDVVYPDGFAMVFATCCGSDIRVWNADSCT